MGEIKFLYKIINDLWNFSNKLGLDTLLLEMLIFILVVVMILKVKRSGGIIVFSEEPAL